MIKLILLLLLSVNLINSQWTSSAYLTWRAKTIVTSPQMGTGYFEADVLYDWPAGMMQVSYNNANSYTEVYTFNSDKGYNGAVLTGQFTFQYLSISSTICPWETLANQYAMPSWWSDSVFSKDPYTGYSYWITGKKIDEPPTLDTTSLANGVSGYVWYANPNFQISTPNGANSYLFSNKIWLDKNNIPVGFQLTDPNNLQKTFTIISLTQASTGSLNISIPNSFRPCSKLIDIVISLDRSGSITVAQWQIEKLFVEFLANDFQYGRRAVNLGIVNWNAELWTTLDINKGFTSDTVFGAIDNMDCCSGTPNPSCCCCGTPLGGGIWAGGNMLLNGRDKATKVLILLTDGCQNYLFYPKPTPHTVPCDCSSEKSCSTNSTCTGDITKWYNWAINKVPGIKIISIGVGDTTTICSDQLLMIAGGDPRNVYNPQAWAEVYSIIRSISTSVCTTNAVPCSDCNGLCTCGVCIPAPNLV